jgi:hypothetical protein
MDPGLGGPKPYGSSGSGSATLVLRNIDFIKVQECSVVSLSLFTIVVIIEEGRAASKTPH